MMRLMVRCLFLFALLAAGASAQNLPVARASAFRMQDGGTSRLMNIEWYDSIATTASLGANLVAMQDTTGTGFLVRTGDSTYTVRSILAGSGIGVANTTGAGGNTTISHTDTSSLSSIDNSGVTFIQDLTVDGFGHATAAVSVSAATALASTFQPLDADLTTIAGLTPTSGAIIRGTGSAWATSALILPNAGTQYQVPYFTATDTLGASANLTFNGTLLQVGAAAVGTAATGLQVGTNMPQLAVGANGQAGRILFGRGADGNTGFGWVGFLGTAGASTPFGLHYGGGGGEMRLNVNASNSALTFYQNATEKMRVHTDGNVGIGDATPDATLETAGTFMVSSAAANDGDRLNVAASSFVINDLGADVDFRIESDGLTSALAIDGGTGLVSIGDDLDVNGDLILEAHVRTTQSTIDQQPITTDEGAWYYLIPNGTVDSGSGTWPAPSKLGMFGTDYNADSANYWLLVIDTDLNRDHITFKSRSGGTPTSRPMVFEFDNDGAITDAMTIQTVGDVTFSRNIRLETANAGIYMTAGGRFGTATLVGGTVTVNTASVTADSVIILTAQNSSGTAGEIYVSARTASTSFTITSTSGSDTRTVGWMIVEPWT